MSVQICPNCKKEVMDSVFCPECGTKLEPVAQEPSPAALPAQPVGSHMFAPLPQAPYAPVATDMYQAGDPYAAMRRFEDEKKARKKKKKTVVGISLAAALLVIACVVTTVFAVKNSLTDSERAQVNELISSIAELPSNVSPEDEGKVEALESEFDGLSVKQQRRVKNRRAIAKAREEIDALKVKEVVDAIDKIGTVTLDSYDDIKAAEEKYDALPDELQLRVTGYDRLSALEDEFCALAAENVVKHIDDIGTVTLKSKSKLDEIEGLYKDLPEKAQELVTNYSDYKEAEKQYAKLLEAEEKRKRAENLEKYRAELKKLKKNSDSIKGYTWFHTQSEPDYVNTRSYFLPYLVTDIDTNDFVNIRMDAHFTDTDWVFWEKLTISVDGENYYRTFNYSDVERVVGDYGDVWEYNDWEATYADIEMLREIANSDKCIVRFEGDRYYCDVQVTDADKHGIKIILAAYDAWNASRE